MAIEMLVEPKRVFSMTVSRPGEGFLIAMKIALQAFEKSIVVFSAGGASKNAKYLGASAIVSSDPLAAARGVSRSEKCHVLVFAGRESAEKSADEFARVKEDVTFICLNNSRLCRQFPAPSASYSASASLAFPEDYMRKLLKARDTKGLSFIDVLCPSPEKWGFDSSNTIEVSRTAVNSGLWHLWEKTDMARQTVKPDAFESVELYIKLQKNLSEKDKETIRKMSAENTNIA